MRCAVRGLFTTVCGNVRRMAAGNGKNVRAVLGWVTVLAAVVVVPDRAGHAQEPMVDLGGQLYAANCAMCHGTNGAGITGEGPDAGPPLTGIDVAYADLTMRTGRMPIVEPRVGIVADPDIGEAERAAIVAWMKQEFGLTGDVPDVAEGDLARGGDLYARNCAACHGSTGAGGISAGATLVRAVKGVDRIGVVEAIRVGPFEMPVFEESVISDQDAADIATYVEYLSEAPATPLGLVEIDRVTMAALAGVLVVAAVGIMVLTSRPVPFLRRDDADD